LVATLPNAANSFGLAHGHPFSSIGFRDPPVQNVDGMTDLSFGPEAPEGSAGNWRATVLGGGYFVIWRFDGPTEAIINRSWQPGDIEAVP
jgi:hypothetical protein